MSFKIYNRRYTGSKYKIVNWIKNIIKAECNDCYSFCDIFAGTAVVTNALINEYSKIWINDFLYSNEIIYKAFFKNENYDRSKIKDFFQRYKKLIPNKIEDNYISKNFGNKFFEYNDSKLIGYIREDIELNKKNLNEKEYCILLASLLYSSDKCANTVGHYEAYRKNIKLNSGFHYKLISPVIKNAKDEREIIITREDSNILAKKISCDLIYIDPPYNNEWHEEMGDDHWELLDNKI